MLSVKILLQPKFLQNNLTVIAKFFILSVLIPENYNTDWHFETQFKNINSI